MVCSNCNDKINIITRRKCAICLRFFCSKCLQKLFPFKGTCAKCLLLKSGRFTQHQLKEYSVKELKSFLVSERLWTGGCVEKEDLVALVFHSASKFTSSREVELHEHQRRVQHMKERLGQKLETSGHQEVDSINIAQNNEEDDYEGEYDIYNDNDDDMANDDDDDDIDNDSFVILDVANGDNHDVSSSRRSVKSSTPPTFSTDSSDITILPTIPPSTPPDPAPASTINSRPFIYPQLNTTSNSPTPFNHDTPHNPPTTTNPPNQPTPLNQQMSSTLPNPPTRPIPTSSSSPIPFLPLPPSYQHLFTPHSDDNHLPNNDEINIQQQILFQEQQQQELYRIEQQNNSRKQQNVQQQQQSQPLQQSQQNSQQQPHSSTGLSGDDASRAKVRKNLDHILRLEELDTETDIVGLTVRQLKIILANNFVTYKGCCEKKELCILVNKLWNGHLKNKAAENNDSTNTDVCKICMEQVIDCVLLECGHMVACTSCSKRLHQCPVCRSLVSRVVHIFKA